jgi:hypothetical protein
MLPELISKLTRDPRYITSALHRIIAINFSNIHSFILIDPLLNRGTTAAGLTPGFKGNT